jgi:hypothetical protein
LRQFAQSIQYTGQIGINLVGVPDGSTDKILVSPEETIEEAIISYLRSKGNRSGLIYLSAVGANNQPLAIDPAKKVGDYFEEGRDYTVYHSREPTYA